MDDKKKLSSKLDSLIEFRAVKAIATSPLGREMLKLRNRAAAEAKTAHSRKKNATMLKKLLDDNKHLMDFSARLDVLLNDPRPRNNLGEFSPQQEGVADPNSMAKTYQHPAKKAAGYGGVALAGGALGAIGGNAGKDAYSAVKKLLSKKKLA